MATVSASMSAAARRASAGVPSTGTPSASSASVEKVQAPDDLEAVVVAPVELLDQVLDVAGVADRQHLVQTSPVAASPAQQGDGGEPAQGEGDEAAGQRDQEEAAGDIGVGRVGGEPDERRHPDAALEQGFDLLGARADALAVVGAAQGEQRQATSVRAEGRPAGSAAGSAARRRTAGTGRRSRRCSR